MNQHPSHAEQLARVQHGERTSTHTNPPKLALSQGGSEVVDIVIEPEQASPEQHIAPSPRTAEAAKKALQQRVASWGTVAAGREVEQ